MDLGEAEQLVLLDGVGDELVRAQRERVLLFVRAREGAELAFHPADVGLVQVDVLDEVDLVAEAALTTREIGELAEREQVIRLHERDAVVEVEALAGEDFLLDRCERFQLENCHYFSRSTTACVRASSSSRWSSPSRLALALPA